MLPPFDAGGTQPLTRERPVPLLAQAKSASLRACRRYRFCLVRTLYVATAGKFGSTAGHAASAVSSVVFGYLVERYGSYNAPLIPMVLTLAAGTLAWLTVDPTKELFARERESVIPSTEAEGA